MIQLIGPGGAGKTTVGRALADRLRMPFIDLDERFTAHAGNISTFLSAYGYQEYAHRNVRVYLDILEKSTEPAVFALSSGFMTYAEGAHPEYARLRREIITSTSTIVLLPSLDYETCVAETVRRQASRPFSRPAEHEEHVIRTRFGLYRDLSLPKFETVKPIVEVVDDLVTYVSRSVDLQCRAPGHG